MANSVHQTGDDEKIDLTAPMSSGDLMTSWQRHAGLAFLSLAYMLNYVDRQMLSVLIEPIRHDLDLSDTQIGLLSGTLFAVFYTFMSVPIAAMADRMRRIPLVSIACFGWSLFTGLSGLVTSFAQLAAARVGIAIGEAGGLAPSLSVISDYFPPQLRVRAIGILTAFAPIGVMIGAIGGGLIAEAYGWRMAFFVPAIVGMILAPAMFFLAPEPRRGTFDPPVGAERSRTTFASVAMLFVRVPSLGWAALSGGLCAIVSNAVIGWMPALMMRGYGASLRDVALFFGPVVGIGLMLGALGSGWIVSRLLSRSIRAYMLVPAGAMLVCAPLFFTALSANNWPALLAIAFLPVVMISAAIPPVVAYSLDLAPADARCMTSALLMVIVNLIGIGLGPVIVGAASDLLKPMAGDDSLRIAMLATLVPIMMLAASTLYAASRSIVKDKLQLERDRQ